MNLFFQFPDFYRLICIIILASKPWSQGPYWNYGWNRRFFMWDKGICRNNGEICQCSLVLPWFDLAYLVPWVLFTKSSVSRSRTQKSQETCSTGRAFFLTLYLFETELGGSLESKSITSVSRHITETFFGECVISEEKWAIPQALQISEELYCISEVPGSLHQFYRLLGHLCSIKWSGMEKYAATLNLCSKAFLRATWHWMDSRGYWRDNLCVEMKIKNTDACLIASEEMLRLQSVEQMKGSFCHVMQETLRLPNQNQSVAKGVSCGTEWLFSLITVCIRLDYLNQLVSAPERSKPALCTPISLILSCLLLVTTARVLRLRNSSWALSEGKASGIAQIRHWKYLN